MSDRERAIQLLDAVPDYKIGYVIANLQGMIVEERRYSDETLVGYEYFLESFDSDYRMRSK